MYGGVKTNLLLLLKQPPFFEKNEATEVFNSDRLSFQTLTTLSTLSFQFGKLWAEALVNYRG